MHKDVSIDKNHKKKRPETVEYYNKTKADVDALDQMSRYYTCKSQLEDGQLHVFSILLIVLA